MPMRESYVEYILSNCGDERISRTCFAYKTIGELIIAAKAEFCGERNILSQVKIINALREYLRQQKEKAFSEDAKKLYDKCASRTDCMYRQNHNRIDINYDELFELLVDINWLVASIWTSEKNQRTEIQLERNVEVLKLRLKNALENDFRQQAELYEQKCGYLEEAYKRKNRFFTGLCSNQEVQQYTRMSTPELKEAMKQSREYSVQKMSLYYVLTATLIKSEQIRRMH